MEFIARDGGVLFGILQFDRRRGTPLLLRRRLTPLGRDSNVIEAGHLIANVRFPKAAVREQRVAVNLNVCFWPKADIQNPYLVA